MLADQPCSEVVNTQGESAMRDVTRTFSTLSPRTSFINLVRGSNSAFSSSSVRIADGALLWTAAHGGAKGLSLVEVVNVHPGDPELQEFEVRTSCKTYSFRVGHSSSGKIIAASLWIYELQRLAAAERIRRGVGETVEAALHVSEARPAPASQRVEACRLEQALRPTGE